MSESSAAALGARRATVSPSKPLGVGFLNCGPRGRDVMQAVRAEPRLRFIAGYDPNTEAKEAFCREFGGEPAASLEALVARPEIDLVMVLVPAFLHKENCLAALAAGKHVFVEKPFALNLADCLEIVRAARSRGLCLYVDQQFRHIKPCPQVRAWAHSGEYGEPFLMHAEIRSGDGAYRGAGAKGWREDVAKFGGFLFEMGVHELDQVLAVMGPATGVQARVIRRRHAPQQVEDVIELWIEHAGGRQSSARFTTIDPGADVRSQQVYCEHGTIEASFAEGGWVRALDRNGRQLARLTATESTGPDEPVGVLLAELIDAIAQGEGRLLGQNGLATVALAEAAHRSAREGRAVMVPSVHTLLSDPA
ncbi:MAG TPA: Gfo/Idh/MocA family oxidoreductase [Limnochordia bacterium]|nr:Gfo/Idh/MocA family oxidoreductase [Limnochordia bacterium]